MDIHIRVLSAVYGIQVHKARILDGEDSREETPVGGRKYGRSNVAAFMEEASRAEEDGAALQASQKGGGCTFSIGDAQSPH